MLQMISYFDLLQIFRQKIIGVKFQDDIGDYVILLPTTTQNSKTGVIEATPFCNLANILHGNTSIM